jgi:hypothetical protein
MKKYITWFIIIVLVILLLLQRECGTPCKDNYIHDTIVSYDTLPGDSVPYSVIIHKPKPYAVYYHDTILSVVDTLAILQDYYAVRSYSDTVSNDSTIKVIINDIITENSIKNREVLFQSLRGNIIQTITINNTPNLKNKLYVGCSLGGKADTYCLGGSLLLQTKKQHIYSYTYDFLNKCNYFNLYYKISFRKPK